MAAPRWRACQAAGARELGLQANQIAPCSSALASNPPRPHRLSDVLEGLRSHIITGNLDLAPNLPIGVVRQADASRLGNALKPRGDIDAVAEDVVIINDDVPDVNADPKFDPLVLRYRRILLGHTALDFNGTAYRIHGARKLDQHAVAGGLDDPPAIVGDGGVNEGLPDSLEPGQRAFLVYAHEAAITGDIRSQHRRQSSFHALARQGAPKWPFADPSKHGGLFVGESQMSGSGQSEKNSVRVFVFRFALKLGHRSMQPVLRFCANR